VASEAFCTLVATIPWWEV